MQDVYMYSNTTFFLTYQQSRHDASVRRRRIVQLNRSDNLIFLRGLPYQLIRLFSHTLYRVSKAGYRNNAGYDMLL
jgi:hypothetical protein